jgi:hypothetical protein
MHCNGLNKECASTSTGWFALQTNPEERKERREEGLSRMIKAVDQRMMFYELRTHNKAKQKVLFQTMKIPLQTNGRKKGGKNKEGGQKTEQRRETQYCECKLANERLEAACAPFRNSASNTAAGQRGTE